jgi:flagellar biosynthesis chaperone FliJ
MAEANKTLLEKVTALETGKIIDAKKQTAQQLFENSEVLKSIKPEIKESWLKRVDVNSETPIEEQITLLETEYSEITQTVADSRLSSGPPAMGNTNNKPDDKLIDTIVDSL